MWALWKIPTVWWSCVTCMHIISCSVGNQLLSLSEHSSDFALWVGYLICRLTLQRKYINHVKNISPCHCICLFPLVTRGQCITGIKLSLCTSEQDGTIDDDDNNVSSRTQDTSALWPIMFLTEMHQILVIKHLTACLWCTLHYASVVMFTGQNNVTSNMFLFSQLGTIALYNFPETFKDNVNILRDAWLPSQSVLPSPHISTVLELQQNTVHHKLHFLRSTGKS